MFTINSLCYRPKSVVTMSAQLEGSEYGGASIAAPTVDIRASLSGDEILEKTISITGVFHVSQAARAVLIFLWTLAPIVDDLLVLNRDAQPSYVLQSRKLKYEWSEAAFQTATLCNVLMSRSIGRPG